MMEPSLDFGKIEVKEEPVDNQVSSSCLPSLEMHRVSKHSEDAVSVCSGTDVKEEDVWIKDEPIEDLDLATSNTTTFFPNPSSIRNRDCDLHKTNPQGTGSSRASRRTQPAATALVPVKSVVNNSGTSAHTEEAAALGASEIRQKWKSLRDSFRRELAIIKKEKSGSAKESEKNEYIYFKQLSFLLPSCKTRPHENEAAVDPTEGRNTEESQPLDCSTHQKKRKKPLPSDKQVLFQALAKKTNAPDDPDKQFLLSLLPDFKSIPESAKLDVKVEFMNILKRYKQHPPFASQQYFPPPHNFFPGPSSSVSDAPHIFSPSIMPSQLKTQNLPLSSPTPSPAPSVTTQVLSP